MRRPQISIAGLILVVFVAALGAAAIRSGSFAWSGAVCSVMWFTMIASLLGVALTRGSRRIYWIGFATLGWGYLLLAFAAWLKDYAGPYLLAPNLFQYLLDILHGEPAVSPGGFQSLAMSGGSPSPPAFTINYLAFRRIGVGLEALLWASLGGWVACGFAASRSASSEPHAT